MATDEPTPVSDLLPEVLRDVWERGRAYREATWTPDEIAEVESALNGDLIREAAE